MTTAFFYLSMAILMIIFLICATRTNAVFVLIFAALTMVFLLLTGAYWRLAVADSLVGNRLVVVSPPASVPATNRQQKSDLFLNFPGRGSFSFHRKHTWVLYVDCATLRFRRFTHTHSCRGSEWALGPS